MLKEISNVQLKNTGAAELSKGLSEVKVKEIKEFNAIKECTALAPDLEKIKTEPLQFIKEANVDKFMYRPLNGCERNVFEKAGLKNLVDETRVDKQGRYYLRCINEELAGKINEYNVKYVEKIISFDDIELIVVMPEFESFFEADVSKELWQRGDDEIFKSCTGQLKERLSNDSSLKEHFSQKQLEQIKCEMPRISGFIWHHTETPGKMQLVSSKIHAFSRHTGGCHIWCGGVR